MTRWRWAALALALAALWLVELAAVAVLGFGLLFAIGDNSVTRGRRGVMR